MQTKPNAFGDVRAENDHRALDEAFFEWQDYKTLFESTDRFIVVGRRGTGKSALAYQLNSVWRGRRSPIISIAPNEEQMIGLRPLASLFGTNVSRIRAGIKIAWKHAILMEMASNLHDDYKTKKAVSEDAFLSREIANWRQLGNSCIARIRARLKKFSEIHSSAEERIADLSDHLGVDALLDHVSSLIESLDRTHVLIVDRLDEGYETDAIGTGIVDGILHGTDEIKTALGEKIRAVVFVRDNILRAIETEDKDFTRNLESQVLRLHWDPQELFYMVARRIRYAFNITKESDVKTWNAITANELHGREGFRRCLQLTLYRPRDVIALLNAAFYQAQRQSRSILIESDFDESARQISATRYNDLSKEYESVLPGIRLLTSSFLSGEAKMKMADALGIIESTMNSEALTEVEAQHFAILEKAEEAIKSLYGVGFIGIYDKQLGSFVFSHDGKKPSREFNSDDVVMIHPCYWPALNIKNPEMSQREAEEIYDEYEITIESHSGEQRKTILGQMMSELNQIPEGNEGATKFENWCKRAIEIIFAKHLTNIQLRPNSNASLRRDIVATNQGSGIWRRVLEDYKTRQVVFEVKNYQKISVDEFRQAHSYLGREYGNLAFIVCRDSEGGLRKGAEIDAFREFYGKGYLIIKFPAQQLVTLLSKLRSPEKFDAGELAIERMLDIYVRMYASGQTDVGASKSTYKKRKRRRNNP